MRITIEYLNKQQKAGKIKGYTGSTKEVKKKSKYGNRKKEVDGILFDSEKEAARYKELKALLKTGVIAFLERQKVYELNPGGTHSVKYRADFEYTIAKTGERITEDVKGYATKVFKKKAKLMWKVHQIKIKLT